MSEARITLNTDFAVNSEESSYLSTLILSLPLSLFLLWFQFYFMTTMDIRTCNSQTRRNSKYRALLVLSCMVWHRVRVRVHSGLMVCPPRRSQQTGSTQCSKSIEWRMTSHRNQTKDPFQCSMQSSKRPMELAQSNRCSLSQGRLQQQQQQQQQEGH
jgi:hypothetical protein